MICANCEHEQSRHKGGTDGCRKCDLGCTLFEEPEGAKAEETRVLTAVAEVCEDQADKARTELAARLGSNGGPALAQSLTQLRRVEQERDELARRVTSLERENERREETVARNVQERDQALDACDALREQRDLARADLASAKERHGIERRLERDAQVKLRQRLLAVEAELAEAYGLVEKIPGRTPIEVLRQVTADGQDARLAASTYPDGQVIAEHVRYLCETCGSRYGFNHEHEHGPLTPVTVTTARQGAPTE